MLTALVNELLKDTKKYFDWAEKGKVMEGCRHRKPVTFVFLIQKNFFLQSSCGKSL
jgi:hypothetical protein